MPGLAAVDDGQGIRSGFLPADVRREYPDAPVAECSPLRGRFRLHGAEERFIDVTDVTVWHVQRMSHA